MTVEEQQSGASSAQDNTTAGQGMPGRQEMNDQMENRLRKLLAYQEAGRDPFEQLSYEVTAHCHDIEENYEAMEGRVVRLAGRIMSKRGMGKASFCDLLDRSGNIQLFVRVDHLGKEAYKDWQSLDLGDWVGVEGEVMKTQKGQISIRVAAFTLLAKTLRALPEKYHGLRDTDTRYRQRYLDLVMNPEVREQFVKRSRIIQTIREELLKRDYLEVETPILNTIPGGAAARPFITHHNALNIDLYLRIAPELYLKRLIVGGMERVFEIGRNFRNEGLSTRHNPEFSMVELYQAYADYKDMMVLAENLVAACCDAVNPSRKIHWQGVELDLNPPFRRLSMREAVLKATGIDFYEVKTDEEAFALCRERGIETQPSWKKGDVFNVFFETYCEEELIQPTFIYDYPIEVSPLTKKKPGQPDITERFELFINGKEFGNAYSELNNPLDQRARFAAQLAKREAGDDEANFLDEDYCVALEYGLPPTGGLGIGIDRLCMLLTNADTIRDVLLFPTMKPIGNKRNLAETGSADLAQDRANATTAVQAVDMGNHAHAMHETEAIDFSKVKVEPLFENLVDFETFSRSDFRAVKVLNCEEVPKSKKLLKFTLNDGSGHERVILSGIKEHYQAAELIGKTLLAICNLPPRKMMGIESEGMIISAIHEEEGVEKLNLLMLSERIPAGAKLY